MEIRCPHCQNPLTIEAQFAGQLMRCPTCSGTFQAPTLASTTNEAWVAPPPTEPVPALAPAPEPTDTPKKKKKERAAAPAPVPEGEYSRTVTLSFNGRLLPWIAPIGLAIIFLLSFFPWHFAPNAHLQPGTPGSPLTAAEGAQNMWQLAFGEKPSSLITMFVILVIFVAWPLAIVSLLISFNIIPLPPPLDLLASFRSIIVGALALAGFVFFAIGYLDQLFGVFNLTTWSMKLAFRIALIVALATIMQFWLDRRRIKNLPPPQLTLRC